MGKHSSSKQSTGKEFLEYVPAMEIESVWYTLHSEILIRTDKVGIRCKILYFILFFGPTTRLAGSSFPDQGLNPGPQR